MIGSSIGICSSHLSQKEIRGCIFRSKDQELDCMKGVIFAFIWCSSKVQCCKLWDSINLLATLLSLILSNVNDLPMSQIIEV